jgi:hypothetical protein
MPLLFLPFLILYGVASPLRHVVLLLCIIAAIRVFAFSSGISLF